MNCTAAPAAPPGKVAAPRPTGASVVSLFSDFRGHPYMPIRLKLLIVTHGISQPELAAAVRQPSGAALSATSMNQIINHGYYPRSTPVASVRGQVEQFLRSRGVPEDEILTCWETAGDTDVARSMQPVGHHPNQGRTRRSSRDRAAVELDFDPLEAPMLTPAARRHFKLFDDPFTADPQGPEDVFLGPDQYDAIEAMLDAVRAGRMFALVGESGSGKTTLLDFVKDKIVADHIPMRIVQPMLPDKARLTGRAMLEALVLDLAPGAVLKNSSEKLARQAHELLANTTAAGTYNVLLFEEAHDLSIAALKELKRFNEFKTRWKKLLSIVLIGQPELLEKLSEEGAVAAREVARRLEHKILMPLDSALAAYIGHRLARRGRKLDELFDAEAILALSARLQGSVRRGNGVEHVSMSYPLLVNRLLIKSLNAATEAGAARVDAGIVRGVK